MEGPIGEDPKNLPKIGNAIKDVDVDTRGGVRWTHPYLPAVGRKSIGDRLKQLLVGKKAEPPKDLSQN